MEKCFSFSLHSLARQKRFTVFFLCSLWGDLEYMNNILSGILVCVASLLSNSSFSPKMSFPSFGRLSVSLYSFTHDVLGILKNRKMTPLTGCNNLIF